MILKLISDLDILHLCNQIQSTMSQRPSHLIKVKCRVCKKPLKHKNYKDHLKQVHPDEDENNLQAATDQSISSFFSSGGPNPKRGRLDGAGGGQVSRHSPSPPRPRKSPAPQHLGTSPSDSEEDEKRVEEAAVSDHKEDEELSESDLFEEDEEVNSRSRGRFYSGESGVGSAGEEMNEEIDEEEGEENEVDVIDEIIEQHKNVIKRLENLKSKIVKRKGDRDSANSAWMREDQERAANTRVQGEVQQEVAAGLGVSAVVEGVVGDLICNLDSGYIVSLADKCIYRIPVKRNVSLADKCIYKFPVKWNVSLADKCIYPVPEKRKYGYMKFV